MSGSGNESSNGPLRARGSHSLQCGPCNYKTFYSVESFVKHQAEKHGNDARDWFDEPLPERWAEAAYEGADRDER